MCNFWKNSLTIAARSATTAAIKNTKLKHQISKLKDNHRKEINKLKKDHKKDIAKIKSKARAKAKVQRVISAVPVIGIGAFGAFEKIEFDNWKSENPEGNFEEYSMEISNDVNELLANEYQIFQGKYSEIKKYSTETGAEISEFMNIEYKKLKNELIGLLPQWAK